MSITKQTILKVLEACSWCAAGGALIVLLISATRIADRKPITGTDIEISGVNNNYFIDRDDVQGVLKRFGNAGHRPVSGLNLALAEEELEQQVWIRNAEMFFDNNGLLKVSVEEREPVIRIFNIAGESFYTDTSLKVLPLSEKFSAALPVFTDFPGREGGFLKSDSILLKGMIEVSLAIQRDSFLTGMIEQTVVQPNGWLEMVPKFGTQKIVFGEADEVAAKFHKLKLFYRKVMRVTGFNRYKEINLRYHEQVVGSLRAREDVIADSLGTMRLLKQIETEAAMRSEDSLRRKQGEDERIQPLQPLMPSAEREESPFIFPNQ